MGDNAKWISENKERYLTKRREWAAKNRERIRQYRKTEAAKASQSESNKKYREKNKDKQREYNAAYLAKRRAERAEWLKLNPPIPKEQKEKDKRKCWFCKVNEPAKWQRFCETKECVQARREKDLELKRQQSIEYKRQNPHIIKAQKRKRRAQKKGVSTENYFNGDIFARDN